MPKRKALRAVEVTWLDAYSTYGWQENASVADKDYPVRSIGYLIKSCPKRIVIAQTVSSAGGGAFAEFLTIPRTWIQRVRKIG